MPTFLRILVVDDRLDSVAVLVDRLRQLHHVVDTTDNSMEALSLVGRKSSAGHPYHLVITDVNMPLLDGVGLVRELRRRNERVPMAFVTGYGSISGKIRTEAAELGVLRVLGKPPANADLDALLARVGGSAGERLTTSSGSAAQDDSMFFGTARMTRPTGTFKPQEGALARARLDEREQVAPVDMDALLKKSNTPAVPAPTTEPVAPEFSGEDRSESVPGRRTRTPDPSAFYSASGTLGGTSAFYKRPKTDPFVPATGKMDPRVAPPPPGTNRDPVTGHYRRTTSGLHQSEPTNFPTTTSRFRRPTGTTPPEASNQLPPVPSAAEDISLTPLGQQALPESRNITSGFRRSITRSVPGTGQTTNSATGPTPKPPTTSSTAAPQTCTVACAHCQGLFQVLLKPAAYTVLCVHCGQLNRIDPLPG